MLTSLSVLSSVPQPCGGAANLARGAGQAAAPLLLLGVWSAYGGAPTGGGLRAGWGGQQREGAAQLPRREGRGAQGHVHHASGRPRTVRISSTPTCYKDAQCDTLLRAPALFSHSTAMHSLSLHASCFSRFFRLREPMLRDQFGAPALPPGVCASISHKDQIAVALVCKGQTHSSSAPRHTEPVHPTRAEGMEARD